MPLSPDSPHLIRKVPAHNELAPDLQRCAASGEFVMLQLENGEILWVVPADGLADLAAIAHSMEFRTLVEESTRDAATASGMALPAGCTPGDLSEAIRSDQTFQTGLGSACEDVAHGRGRAAPKGWRPSP
jgi:hypothetical protein